jgi:heterodisulfide reductase subunit C
LTIKVRDSIIPKIIELGASKVSSCYLCGSCSVACPQSAKTGDFPGKLIQYAKLGLEDHIYNSKLLQSCDFCDKCSEKCSRSADPNSFMKAIRQYFYESEILSDLDNAVQVDI